MSQAVTLDYVNWYLVHNDKNARVMTTIGARDYRCLSLCALDDLYAQPAARTPNWNLYKAEGPSTNEGRDAWTLVASFCAPDEVKGWRCVSRK